MTGPCRRSERSWIGSDDESFDCAGIPSAPRVANQRVPKDAQVSGFLEQAPELIIEVLGDDRSWSEMEEKISEYHAAGVNLVWVLDPRTLTLQICARGASPVLREAVTASADPHVPGFSCRVADFFAS